MSEQSPAQKKQNVVIIDGDGGVPELKRQNAVIDPWVASQELDNMAKQSYGQYGGNTFQESTNSGGMGLDDFFTSQTPNPQPYDLLSPVVMDTVTHSPRPSYLPPSPTFPNPMWQFPPPTQEFTKSQLNDLRMEQNTLIYPFADTTKKPQEANAEKPVDSSAPSEKKVVGPSKKPTSLKLTMPKVSFFQTRIIFMEKYCL